MGSILAPGKNRVFNLAYNLTNVDDDDRPGSSSHTKPLKNTIEFI
jgi:hypothetical protein